MSRRRYWVVHCPDCKTSYIRFADGATLGTLCEHSTRPEKKENS